MRKGNFLRTERKLFSIELDLHKLSQDLMKKKIADTESYSIIETFIESTEKSELFQMLCISRLHSSESEKHQVFSQALFKIAEDHRLQKITPREYISHDEYYHKLLNSPMDSVEHKMRLTFTYMSVKFSIEFLENRNFTALQVELPVTDSTSRSDDYLEMLSDFEAITVIEPLDLTLEEVFYQKHVRQLV